MLSSAAVVKVWSGANSTKDLVKLVSRGALKLPPLPRSSVTPFIEAKLSALTAPLSGTISVPPLWLRTAGMLRVEPAPIVNDVSPRLVSASRSSVPPAITSKLARPAEASAGRLNAGTSMSKRVFPELAELMVTRPSRLMSLPLPMMTYNQSSARLGPVIVSTPDRLIRPPASASMR